MAEKDKVERDYNEFKAKVDALSKTELERIKRRAAELKWEAEKVGEKVEASMDEAEAAADKKKS